MKYITIKIKEKEYIIKTCFRSYLLYEEMTGKQINELKTMTDSITFLYCTLKGSNYKEWDYSYDDFIDLLDEYPEIFEKFNEFNNTIETVEPEKKRKKD